MVPIPRGSLESLIKSTNLKIRVNGGVRFVWGSDSQGGWRISAGGSGC